MRIPYFRVMLAASATIAFMLFLAGCDKGQPHEHTYGDWSVENATCTEDGKKTRTCECGETETETILATGHDSGKWIVQSQATCTEDGSEHLVCTVCQATLSTLTTPAAHTPSSDWITDSDATCTTTGSKHLECTTCHETLKTESIRAKGHVTNADWITDIEATCTEKGSRHLECPVCNGTLKTEAIPAKGHTINDEWIIDFEATCTEDGGQHKVCVVCAATLQTEVLPSLEHNHVGALNESEDGTKTVVYTCERCEDSYSSELTPISVSAALTGSSLNLGSTRPYGRSFTVEASGGFGTYKYKFESGSNLLRDYGDSNVISVYGNAFIDLAQITITVMDEAGQETVYIIRGDGTYIDSYVKTEEEA